MENKLLSNTLVEMKTCKNGMFLLLRLTQNNTKCFNDTRLGFNYDMYNNAGQMLPFCWAGK